MPKINDRLGKDNSMPSKAKLITPFFLSVLLLAIILLICGYRSAHIIPQSTLSAQENLLADMEQAADAAAASDVAADAFQPLNLNAATESQLQTLPGIGPVKAAAIVAYRQEIGGFSDKSQLLDVYGIGEKTYADIKDLVYVE